MAVAAMTMAAVTAATNKMAATAAMAETAATKVAEARRRRSGKGVARAETPKASSPRPKFGVKGYRRILLTFPLVVVCDDFEYKATTWGSLLKYRCPHELLGEVTEQHGVFLANIHFPVYSRKC